MINRFLASPFLASSLVLMCLLAGCRSSEPDLTWQRIQQLGVIRVGMDPNWLPFEYVDGSGQLSGFDVEVAGELGNRLGLEVHLVANLSFDALYDALMAAQADAVISAVVIDVGRSADFYFSTPYFDAGQVLVIGPTGTDIDAMEDLSGRVLAVELGSNADIVARRWARRLADLSLLHVESADGALNAGASRQADAALTDRATALMALKADGGRRTSDERPIIGHSNLQISGEPVTDEQYAVVVRRESGTLLRAINAALADMRRDGTLEELERKWLGP